MSQTEDGHSLAAKLNRAMLPLDKSDKVQSSAWADALCEASNLLYAASRTLPPDTNREPLLRHVRALNEEINQHQDSVRAT